MEGSKDGERQQQEERGDPSKEEDTKEVRGDAKKLQQDGRDYVRVNGKEQRVKAGAARGEPDTRTPSHVPGWTCLHKVQSNFSKGTPIETRRMGRGKGEDKGYQPYKEKVNEVGGKGDTPD
ncbi:hypothetical protein NDU88_005128 [Pleurodeles waltl]|uniref:Uncharacterized protein n=1 Tax=Pleurodeles waltl TaxID=8319 RepID=A0AAV7UHX1_PLEWA|nr:hypothetical protein NDU88_005128 [Pleurodeles waltl]